MRKGSDKPVMVLQRLNNWSWASFPLYNFVSQVSEAKCRHSVNANIQHQTARSASPAGTGYHSWRYGLKNQFQEWVYLKIPSNRITFWYPFHILYSETYKIKQLISPIGLLDNHIWKSMDIKKTIMSILKPTYTNLLTERMKIQIHLPPDPFLCPQTRRNMEFPNLHAKKKYFNLWGFIHTPFQGALWGIFFTGVIFCCIDNLACGPDCL